MSSERQEAVTRVGHEHFFYYRGTPWEREEAVVPPFKYRWMNGRETLRNLYGNGFLFCTTSGNKLDAALRMLRMAEALSPHLPMYFTGSLASEKQTTDPGRISRSKIMDAIVNTRRYWGQAKGPSDRESSIMAVEPPFPDRKLDAGFSYMEEAVSQTFGLVDASDARLLTRDLLPITKAPHADAVLKEVIEHLKQPNTLILESGIFMLFPETCYEIEGPNPLAMGIELTLRDVLEFDALNEVDISYLKEQGSRWIGAPGGLHLSWLIQRGKLRTINGMDIDRLPAVQQYIGFASKGFHPLVLAILGAHERTPAGLSTIDSRFVSSLICSREYASHKQTFLGLGGITYALQELRGYVTDDASYGAMHALEQTFGEVEKFDDKRNRVYDSRTKEDLIAAWKIREFKEGTLD